MESPSDAGVKLTIEGSDCVLALRGSFHLELAQPLYQAALEAADSGRAVRVDCHAVEHLDGCALQTLLALKAALDRAARPIRLIGVSEAVRKYLAWAGLAGHFPDETSEEPGRGPAQAVRPRQRRSRNRKQES